MKLDELREVVKEVLQEQFKGFYDPGPRKTMLPSLPRQKQGPDEIQKVDPAKLPRGQGKSLSYLEAKTEEEAREEIKRNFSDFPGRIKLYLDLEGNYFLLLDYGRLGT